MSGKRQHATFVEKVFVERQSLLDEMMEVKHIRTVFNVFITIFCVLVINNVAMGIIDIESSRLVLEFDVLFYAFGKFQTVVGTWLHMFFYTLLVPFKALHLWSSWYHTSCFPRLLSATMAGLLIICHVCVLGFYPIYVIIWHRLPPVSRLIIILEKIRFMMKSYSFLREVTPKIIQMKINKEKEVELPTFSGYLYFLFCPTMIYRESYPRTPFIRWKYVIKYFAQGFGCVLYLYFILVTLCIPVFINTSKQPFSTKTLIQSIFHATLPGILILLVSFYGFLHCWLNAFAEMLRFADRMFYKLLNKRFRTLALLAVFLLSAVIHEYAMTLIFGFFYPVMLCLFTGFGVFFNFAMNDKRTSPIWNVFLWIFLFIGHGILVCLYSQEWYAQIHCPLQEKTFWTLVTPRSWSCYLQQ
uniref:O-acyltransferase n=1 Tax=Geotrypetes seraphini TaxID=260995 RepID=A0A6P8QI05_GEOSA|nr:sterol O-acyltransferase 2 isoform X2 [Geotrypetes seraphini]